MHFVHGDDDDDDDHSPLMKPMASWPLYLPHAVPERCEFAHAATRRHLHTKPCIDIHTHTHMIRSESCCAHAHATQKNQNIHTHNQSGRRGRTGFFRVFRARTSADSCSVCAHMRVNLSVHGRLCRVVCVVFCCGLSESWLRESINYLQISASSTTA